jgi:putative transposase
MFWHCRDTIDKTVVMYNAPRLKGYDYSRSGLYFITIDCFLMECRFREIFKTQMHLNDLGKIAYEEWYKLPIRYAHIALHEFQIMPNHLHGIVEILNHEESATKLPDLSDMMGAYKSLVANECLKLHKSIHAGKQYVPLFGKLWSRGYFDRILWDKPSYKSVSRYIRNNAKKWNRL